MNRSLNMLLWTGALALASSNLWFSSARADEPLAAKQPAQAAAADNVVVATQSTSLMVGWKSVAPVAAGQELKVLSTRDGWIGTWVESGGHKTYGWLWGNFAASPGSTAVAAAPNVRRSYSYDPSESENAVATPRPVYRERSYSGSGGYRGSNRGSSSRTPLYLLPKGDPRKSGGR